MSTTAKLTFGATCIFTVGITTYVHYKQIFDRNEMHKGITLEEERKEQRKTENRQKLLDQEKLTKAYQLRQLAEDNADKK